MPGACTSARGGEATNAAGGLAHSGIIQLDYYLLQPAGVQLAYLILC